MNHCNNYVRAIFLPSPANHKSSNLGIGDRFAAFDSKYRKIDSQGSHISETATILICLKTYRNKGNLVNVK